MVVAETEIFDCRPIDINQKQLGTLGIVNRRMYKIRQPIHVPLKDIEHSQYLDNAKDSLRTDPTTKKGSFFGQVSCRFFLT
jgi:hypothetical protein